MISALAKNLKCLITSHTQKVLYFMLSLTLIKVCVCVCVCAHAAAVAAVTAEEEEGVAWQGHDVYL